MKYSKNKLTTELNIFEFERGLKSKIISEIDGYNPTFFFIYPNEDDVDIVFDNKRHIHCIYLSLDYQDTVINYDYSIGIPIKVLGEKYE